MFYVVGVLSDVMLYGLGIESIEANDIICVQDKYLFVHTEMGALYELFNTFTILFYSWVMYQVFYNLPVKYKMVSF